MKAIDVHVYYGKWYFPIPYRSVDDILEAMGRRNIEQALMMSSLSIIGDFARGNEMLFADIAGHDNLYGYCYINGNYVAESFEQMEMYLPLRQCCGIKYHPEYSGKRPDDAEVRPLFEKLAYEYKKPALIHSWPYGEHGNATPSSHPRFIAGLAERLPELRIVMGHMGGPEWQEAIDIAKPYSNLYLDTGSSYTHYDKVKSAVEALGAERVLFGSGFTECNLDAQMGVVLESEISDSERETVFYGAAAQLFNL